MRPSLVVTRQQFGDLNRTISPEVSRHGLKSEEGTDPVIRILLRSCLETCMGCLPGCPLVAGFVFAKLAPNN